MSKRTSAVSPAQAVTAEDVVPCVKILVVGNGSVGKSSMIRRFCKGSYNENYKKTIGVEYLEREVEVPGFGEVRLMLWDTAGQEEFDEMTREYYKETDAVALAFSTADRPSFETIKAWRAKIESAGDELAMVLVQNKIDLAHQAAVSTQEAEALARELKVPLFRVSVKEYLNVEEVFVYLAEKHLKRKREKQQAAAAAKEAKIAKRRSAEAARRDSPNPAAAQPTSAIANTEERRVSSTRPHIATGRKDDKCIIQ